MHVEDVGGCWAWTVLSMETAQLHPCRKLTGEPEFAHDSGLDGYLRLGVLTTYGGYWPCLPTSRDRTSLILVATRSFSGQLCSFLYEAENCLPVPHRAASSALQRFQKRAQFPFQVPFYFRLLSPLGQP